MTGVADLIAPAARVFIGSGAAAFPTAPAAKIVAAGHDATGENSLAYTLTTPTLSAYGGANAALTFGSPPLVITGTFTGWGTADVSAPSALVSITGTLSGQASAALTFGQLGSTYNLVGYSGAVVAVTLSDSPTVVATGLGGSIGQGTLTLPLFDLMASGTVNGLSYAELLMPSAALGATAQAWLIGPAATLVAVGTATVVSTYEAYAVNLNHTPKHGVIPVDEMTHYTAYPFDRIVRYKNSYYGMNSTGLYLLEGTVDLTAPAAWAVRSAETDMGTVQQKTVEMAYFGGRMAPASTINLYAGEGAVQPYSYTTPRGELAQNYRQPFGRGIKARYYAFGVAGSGTLNIDSVTFNVATLARKV